MVTMKLEEAIAIGETATDDEGSPVCLDWAPLTVDERAVELIIEGSYCETPLEDDVMVGRHMIYVSEWFSPERERVPFDEFGLFAAYLVPTDLSDIADDVSSQGEVGDDTHSVIADFSWLDE